jgi:hypothetical protein
MAAFQLLQGIAHYQMSPVKKKKQKEEISPGYINGSSWQKSTMQKQLCR